MMKRKESHSYHVFIFMAVVIVAAGCARSAVNYSSGPLAMAHEYFSLAPAMADAQSSVEEQKSTTGTEIDRYRAILEQKFELKPPLTILVVIPQPRYGWWDYVYPSYFDGFSGMIFNALSAKVTDSEFVGELKLSSSLFSFGTIDNLLEIAARYRADECLLLSFNLSVYQPSFCLGFWPASYWVGSLNTQTMLVDTRTGFFLTGHTYSIQKRSSTTVLLNLNKDEELMKLLVTDLADAVIADLTTYYKKESK